MNKQKGFGAIEFLVITVIIGALALFVVSGVVDYKTRYNSAERTAERYLEAIVICGEGNIIQNEREFDCKDFLLIK